IFFFFQAEDGIRDRTVTGVQTCALPIFRILSLEELERGHLLCREVVAKHDRIARTQFLTQLAVGEIRVHRLQAVGIQSARSLVRSEERRVGKECRGRWASEQESDETKRV